MSPWGAVTPWPGHAGDGGDATLDWFVAADDRWHRPSDEPTVRQRRVGGAPVVETRIRIPDGDAVHRVWSVADAGGLTVVEVENESPLPFAVALTGLDVLTERPPADVPVQGIDLPAGTITLPVGHRATVRVAIAHSRPARKVDLAAVPGPTEVTRGWSAITSRASRLELPDEALAEAVFAARCDLVLDGPVAPDADPVGFVLDANELVRCGDDAADWLVELVGPLEVAARAGSPQLSAALFAAERVAAAAGDARAVADIVRLRARAQPPIEALRPMSEIRRDGAVGRFVHDVEQHFARGRDLLPGGIPTRWLGHDFEVHGVPTSARSAVSYAVRWHGARPAVLWEQSGEPGRLTAGAVDDGWATSETSGEALWPAPPTAASTPLTVRAAPPSGPAGAASS